MTAEGNDIVRMIRSLPLSLIALLSAGSAWAAVPGCVRMPEPQIIVDSRAAPPAHDYTRSVAELGGISRDSGAAARGRPGKILGLATVRYGNGEGAKLAVARQTDGSLCVAPSEIHITLALDERRVYVARELPEGTCIHGEVLAHEMRHVQTDERLLAEFLPRVAPRVRGELRRLGTYRVSTQDEAWGRLNAVMKPLMQSLMRDFGAERSARQARIDTLLEYRRVSVSCNGELAKYLPRGEGSF